MEQILAFLWNTLLQVGTSFLHNWPFLLISVAVSVLLKLYVDSNQVTDFLLRHQRAGVVGATLAAVGTPFCSCGTTAVILGMMASRLPWAPIVAFMVASPLTSPEELFYSAGLFGWPFAITFFAASIVLGLLGGLAAAIFESRGWLKNQARFVDTATVNAAVSEPVMRAQPTPALAFAAVSASNAASASDTVTGCGCGVNAPVRELYPVTVRAKPLSEPVSVGCGCGAPARPAANPSSYPVAVAAAQPAASCACGSTPAQVVTPPAAKQRVTARVFGLEMWRSGTRLLAMFLGFAFIGYLLNGLIPQAWIAAVFGTGSAYSVPLAATLGLPLYINTEGSLPLVRALIEGGMSQGAALAFLITGAGTSIGALTGALTIAKWRVIGLVIGTLWVGAIATGLLFDLLF